MRKELIVGKNMHVLSWGTIGSRFQELVVGVTRPRVGYWEASDPASCNKEVGVYRVWYYGICIRLRIWLYKIDAPWSGKGYI